MNFDLNKGYLIRKSQDEETVSFRVCFGYRRDWFAVDITIDKSKFKEISKLESSISVQITVDEAASNLTKNLFVKKPRFMR